jgi:hypothetical protein
MIHKVFSRVSYAEDLARIRKASNKNNKRTDTVGERDQIGVGVACILDPDVKTTKRRK